MTRIPDLGDKKSSDFTKKFANLADILLQYQTDLSGVEANIALKGKTLDEANKENCGWQYFYERRKVELGTLVKYLDLEVNRVRGSLYRSLLQTNQRDMSDRMRDKLIDSEPSYLNMYELYLEVNELYEQYKSVVDNFIARQYALTNLVKLRVHEIESTSM